MCTYVLPDSGVVDASSGDRVGASCDDAGDDDVFSDLDEDEDEEEEELSDIVEISDEGQGRFIRVAGHLLQQTHFQH